MQNSFGEQKVFEEAGYKFTVLNNAPGTVNKVIERIKNFPNRTEIPEGGFSMLEGLTGITVPEGVEIIADDAFNGCISLNQINMPSTVNNIGNRVFDGCDKLVRIQIPESVLEKIGGAANLYENSNLDRNVRINIVNMPSIGDKAFMGRKDLTKVTIPEGVTSIGESAFNGCSNLTQVIMPSSMKSIGTFAFNGCSSLTEINIPSSVTNISGAAFSGCSSLTKINIPNNVTEIDNFTFYNCSSLTEIDIPNGVTSIWDSAFRGCSNLTQVNIPNGVTYIGDNAFNRCKSLQKINIPTHLFVQEFGGNVNSVREKLGLNSDVKIFVDGKELNFDINELKAKIPGLLANLKEMGTSKSDLKSIAKNDIFKKSNPNINVFDKLNAKKNSEKTKPPQTKDSI